MNVICKPEFLIKKPETYKPPTPSQVDSVHIM